MVRLRKQFEGLAHEERTTQFAILKTIFNAIIFSIAGFGFVGVVVFSCVHWTSFS
jgi:hypothetical protein